MKIRSSFQNSGQALRTFMSSWLGSIRRRPRASGLVWAGRSSVQQICSSQPRGIILDKTDLSLSLSLSFVSLSVSLLLSLSLSLSLYIYIYIYMYFWIYIYIYAFI